VGLDRIVPLAYVDGMEKELRKQLNIRVDDAFWAAIDDIRRAGRPIPTVTDAVMAAVMDYRDKVVKRKKEPAHG